MVRIIKSTVFIMIMLLLTVVLIVVIFSVIFQSIIFFISFQIENEFRKCIILNTLPKVKVQSPV